MSRLRQRGDAERGFLEFSGAGFRGSGSLELEGRKSAILSPERVVGFVFFVGFVETNIVRQNEKIRSRT